MLIRQNDDQQLSELSLLCNTGEGELFSNISANLANGWPKFKIGEKIEQPAIVCGSGPSIADSLESIRSMKKRGGKVFALNGAAKYLSENGIKPDVQIIVDPRPGDICFVEKAWAGEVWLASQCHPSVYAQCERIGYPVKLWHPSSPTIQNTIPAKQSLLIGGGYTVGLSGLCLIHTAGHREFHLFGYDSSHKNDKGHAFVQDMNKEDELVNATVDSKRFTCSVTMAGQASEWPVVSKMLIEDGCELHVHGEGLLPTLWRMEMKDKALRVLNAVYDLGVSPPTYEFLSFLAAAERHRIETGFDVMDIVIEPGPMFGFRDDELPPNLAGRRAMLWRVCVAMTQLLPSIRNVKVAKKREPVSGDVFPVGWAENSPIACYGPQFQKKAWIMLRSSEFAQKQVAMRFSKPYATITLRESSYWPTRNSNLDAWRVVANWLIENNIQPVFVPDTEGVGMGGTYTEFTPASFDLDLRAALYEGAVINLGVANGPMALCSFIDCRYLQFKVGTDPDTTNSVEFWKSRGFNEGESPDGNGKWIWKPDSSANIIEELVKLNLTEKTSCPA